MQHGAVHNRDPARYRAATRAIEAIYWSEKAAVMIQRLSSQRGQDVLSPAVLQ